MDIEKISINLLRYTFLLIFSGRCRLCYHDASATYCNFSTHCFYRPSPDSTKDTSEDNIVLWSLTASESFVKRLLSMFVCRRSSQNVFAYTVRHPSQRRIGFLSVSGTRAKTDELHTGEQLLCMHANNPLGMVSIIYIFSHIALQRHIFSSAPFEHFATFNSKDGFFRRDDEV
jgi:hypothetical protein